MNSKTLPWAGCYLVGIGVIHNIFGLIVGWAPLTEAIAAGAIGVWDDPPVRGFIYWYLSYGAMLWLAGAAVAHLERTKTPPSLPILSTLGFLAMIGVITQPASGLWLLFIPLAILIKQRKARARQAY